MQRRDFLQLMGTAAASTLLPRFALGDNGKRPNVIIFLADDLGYGDLGCFGHPIIQTPNLDRFCGEGMKLTSCYSACAVCSPSRSAIQTGRTPYRNGVFTWIPENSDIHLRSSEVTIASLMQAQGYATCHVGKWHLNGKFNSPEQPQPNDHGYDWWLATQNNAAPSHKDPVNFVRNGLPMGPLEGFSAPLIALEATSWLDNEWDRDKPFFMTVWTHEPHLPIESDPRFMAMYPELKDEGSLQHHANVTQIDWAFGTVMDALRRNGLDDNTFVFFTSDNGPAGNGTAGRTRGSTGGLRGRKGSLYEGGIRVPGMVRWPGHVRPGSVSDQSVVGSDLFTTVCAITGAQVPSDRPIDGASILPALEGKPIQRDIPLYWRWEGTGGPKLALRDGDWKLLSDLEFTQLELYNLREDAGETADLAEEQPERVEAMKQTLMKLDKQIIAEGPDWWQGYYPQRQRSGPLAKGEDKTGAFDIVKGGTVTKSDLGYQLEGEDEVLALKKLAKPVTDRMTLKCNYQTMSESGVKNACIVFGATDKNDELIKCGTLIGKSVHAIFEGTFNNNSRGKQVKVGFDKGKLFEAQVTVDLAKQTVTLTVDGETVTSPLPKGLKSVQYYGIYAKGTKTAFSEVEVGQ